MGPEVEMVVAGGASLGEGPLWDPAAGVLRWVDILRHEIHRFDPRTGEDTAESACGPVAALAPVEGGGLLAAVGGTVYRLDGVRGDGAAEGGRAGGALAAGAGGAGTAPSATARARRLAGLPSGDRANDGKCDPYGRFLIGTLTERQHSGACGLYRLDGPDRVSEVIGGVTLANGLGWSPDGTRLYFVDTPTRAVDVLDYDLESGTARARRTFADLGHVPGRPDGLTVDAEGGVWVALVRGGEVRRYDEHGRLDAVVRLPARRVTSCAFGGPGLDELYVTSGRFGMTEDEIAREPSAGALFRIRPGVTGLPAHAWRPFREIRNRFPLTAVRALPRISATVRGQTTQAISEPPESPRPSEEAE